MEDSSLGHLTMQSCHAHRHLPMKMQLAVPCDWSTPSQPVQAGTVQIISLESACFARRAAHAIHLSGDTSGIQVGSFAASNKTTCHQAVYP